MRNIISLLLLQAAFSSIFLPSAHGANTIIQPTCKKTPFYDLCVSVLQTDSRSATADVQGLAVVAADKLAGKSTATLKQITSLAKKDPRYKACLESYNIVVKYDMQEILQAVSGDPKFAEQGASDVANEADTCGKSIQSFKSVVADSNKFVHDFSLVVVAIVRLLL
ncbi:hypothetical protein SLE2022_254500 [Rubroshorea leprosula]